MEKHIELPRRQLTVESTDLLRQTIVSVLAELLKRSCPCHYPRYRELTSFLHDNYKAVAVFCADTNYLIARSVQSGFLKEIKRIKDSGLGDYDDILYRCTKCSTIYRHVTRQYSINFEFSYFIIEDRQSGEDVGAKVIKPFPLMQGLFGFDDHEIAKCSHDFRLANPTEFFNYLTETP